MKIKIRPFKLASRAKTVLLLLSLASLTGATHFALAASSSELLEKGIYSEETKGDLETAIQLYQQVVVEGKAGDAVAAQAQYRLGVCNYKKKNYTQATAAFEKLVKDYPDQKDLVVKASEYLANSVNLLPAPWVDGEDLRFDVKFPSGFKIGMAEYTVDSDQLNGRSIWRLSSFLCAGVIQFSRVEAEADSFKPIHSRWKHTLIGDADTVFSKGQATLKMAGKDEAKTIDLSGVIYDNEEALQLMRRLPLTPNYKSTVTIYTGLGGGTTMPLGVEVVKQEKVQVPAGTFDCYKVELSVKQSFWYSSDEHRYLVKFEGGGIVAELNSISQRKPGDPVRYSSAVLNGTLTAPPGWVFFQQDEKLDKGKFSVMVLDPEAMATTMVKAASLDTFKPEDKKSVRELAEHEIAEGSPALKAFKVRPESWDARPVASNPGVSVIGDLEEGSEKKVVCAVFTFSGTNAVEFLTFVGSKDWEAFKPKFDAIVDSYTGK